MKRKTQTAPRRPDVPGGGRTPPPPRFLPLIVAAGLLASAGFVAAADLPTLRPGLWESRVRQDPGPPVPGVTRMCLDASVQRQLIRSGEGFAENLCRRSEVRNDAGQIVTEADCEVAGTRIRSRSVTTFMGDTGYRTEVQATYTPPLAGRAESRTIIEGRHAGACLPGMTPGDLILPDGRMVSVGGQGAPVTK